MMMSGKVVVGAHPWVYASRREDRDVFPIIDEVIGDIAYAGFDGIELMHTTLMHDDAVGTIGPACEENSLRVIGSSFGGAMWDASQHEEILNHARLVVERLAQLGGTTLGVSTGNTADPKTRQELDAQAKLLKQIMSTCSDHGVRMNLHNHTYEVEDDEYELSETLRRLPGVRLGPDLDWLTRAGIDPIEFIENHGKRIVFLHLRDNKDGRWVESVGEGEVDFAAIRKALDRVGFAGHAVVELAWEPDFEPTRPLRESLKMSREHIRRTMGW
jgi:sugar phosphate isomerase/epimerase